MIKKSITASPGRHDIAPPIKYPTHARRRPFWLPASNFYVLAFGITIASFFLIWGVLHDGDEAMPWIPAGVGAGLILFGAVFLREIILRRYRDRYLIAASRLDRNLESVSARGAGSNAKKLTIEQNAELIKQIKRKSAAANILARLPEGHLEVFDFCGEYLRLTERELETVPAGSPRLAAFRRGRDVADAIRKEHLLVWAEIEAKRFTKDAQVRVTIAEKIETAQRAFDVLATALEHYPDEPNLANSQTAVRELIGSMRVGHWIELAERAEFKGNYRRAVSHYKDALFFMAREGGQTPDAETLAVRINFEIERISNMARRGNTKKPTKDDD
jgi:hypothetical protein